MLKLAASFGSWRWRGHFAKVRDVQPSGRLCRNTPLKLSNYTYGVKCAADRQLAISTGGLRYGAVWRDAQPGTDWAGDHRGSVDLHRGRAVSPDSSAASPLSVVGLSSSAGSGFCRPNPHRAVLYRSGLFYRHVCGPSSVWNPPARTRSGEESEKNVRAVLGSTLGAAVVYIVSPAGIVPNMDLANSGAVPGWLSRRFHAGSRESDYGSDGDVLLRLLFCV